MGLVPDYMVREPIRQGRIVPGMCDHEFHINQGRMFMLYMPNRFQSAATRTLIDFLGDRMGLARVIRPEMPPQHESKLVDDWSVLH